MRSYQYQENLFRIPRRVVFNLPTKVSHLWDHLKSCLSPAEPLVLAFLSASPPNHDLNLILPCVKQPLITAPFTQFFFYFPAVFSKFQCSFNSKVKICTTHTFILSCFSHFNFDSSFVHLHRVDTSVNSV